MNLIIGNYHIQITRFNLNGRERTYKLYTRRRKKGYCIQCGKKVKRINKQTGLPYRKCEKHRKAENKNSYKRRINL